MSNCDLYRSTGDFACCLQLCFVQSFDDFLIHPVIGLPRLLTVCNADLLTDIPDKPHDILHKAKKESTRDSFSTQVFINHAEDGS